MALSGSTMADSDCVPIVTVHKVTAQHTRNCVRSRVLIYWEYCLPLILVKFTSKLPLVLILYMSDVVALSLETDVLDVLWLIQYTTIVIFFIT